MLKRKGLSKLGCEVMPFELKSFEAFVDEATAEELYKRAATEVRTRAQGVKPEELRMLVAVRPDLFFAITFAIFGPFPLDEKRARQFGVITLQYPNSTLSTRQHGSADQWSAAPTEIPLQHWKFLET